MEWLLPLIIVFYVLTCLANFLLDFLNLRHLRRYGSEVPPEFSGVIDREALQKANAYTFANLRFEMVHGAYNEIIALVFIFGGILPWYNCLLYNFHLKYHWPFAVWGLIFVMVLSYAKTLLNIPFRLYSTFSIERRFGFNTMSVLLWFSDLLKSL
ncbi:MAG: hypothetical protein PHV59_12475, partial [Victivallales bacterium]|nr:hypothetical protein [Victivallales bacterium]